MYEIVTIGRKPVQLVLDAAISEQTAWNCVALALITGVAVAIYERSPAALLYPAAVLALFGFLSHLVNKYRKEE